MMSNVFRAMAAGLGLLAAFAGSAGGVESAVEASENVRARLVADVNAVAPGETFTIALHQEMNPGWHTYWRNPGDSGEPTDIAWTTSPGVTIGDIIWPTPEAIPVAGVLTNYGYEDELFLMATATAPDTAVIGSTLTITADVTWLECEEICIPVEDIILTIDLPVVAGSPAPDTKWAAPLARAMAEAPAPVDFAAGVERTDEGVVLTIADAQLAEPLAEGGVRDVYFFPFAGDVIDHNAPQEVVYGERGMAISLSPSSAWREEVTPTAGVLRFDQRSAAAVWTSQAAEIDIDVGAVDIGAIAVSGAGANGITAAGVGGAGVGGAGVGGDGAALTLGGLAALLGLGLVGGLILNLMPCVFPVLSIKAAGFVAKAHDDAGEIRRHGLLFLAGVLSSFAVLAVALIGLQAALGGAAVYGAWLQNPLIVTALAVVVFLIGLNLLGLFDVGMSVQNVGSGLAAQGGDAGAFFTGVLAVIVGAPCTGPLMAGALGAVFGQPAPIVIVFFLLMGVGLAAPFVALSFSPGLLRLLPKPGAWMNTVKQILAFPMFLTAVWLVWTVAGQLGANGAGLALLALVASGFVVWAFTSFAKAGVGVWIARAAGLGALVVLGAGLIGSGAASRINVIEEPWSAQTVAQHQSQGRMVFVDFTASWCITCQVNKLTTLNTTKVRQAFAEHDVVFLTADWTSEDSVIASELARYGRAGVPLYLLYGTDGEVEILPQTLTPALVIDAVKAASSAGT